MSQPLIGPVPYPDLPAQPAFPTWCVNWNAYDVPRLWDIVRLEDDELGWEQISGFRQLSELLVDQYRRLRTQMTNLADAWRAPAADVFLSRLDGFSLSLLSDAHCAATTANALDGIMTTYANARMKIGILENHWNNVTSDWVPEWWDQAAAELNTEAAKVMLETDTAVRDHRSRIIIPAVPHSVREGSFTASNSSNDGSDTPSNQAVIVPPVPGYAPKGTDGSRPTGVGPSLAGGPAPIPATPGQPVSMLPIPPGSQYAPHGGAYILPGPGIGPGGFIVPLRGGQSGQTGPRPPAVFGSGSSPAAGAMMPVPVTGTNAAQHGGSALYRRKPNYVWPMDKGVPPVIEPIDDDAVIPGQPSAQQEEAFKQWFAELAHPWRGKGGTDEPQIILRRVAG